jgi:uncharacterized membrane protein YsdA (DUF1294 family)/cold shock CspA family protein
MATCRQVWPVVAVGVKLLRCIDHLRTLSTFMRFGGFVKSWNDDRGFGFIEADQGGQEVFVHIKAFPARAGRPQLNQRVTFEIELNREGKKRAKNVELARLPISVKPRQNNSPAQWGTASLFAIPAFLLVYLLVALVWRVPNWFAALYIGVSVVCFGAYAVDKSAAVAGSWRIPESTLLFLGVAGGWPGAIVAQQVLRHKSTKASFRSAFWNTVALNVIAFVGVNSPFMSAFLK